MTPSHNISRSAKLAVLGSLVESTGDSVISESLDGVILTWNAGGTSHFGYGAEEMIGQPVARLIPPDLLDRRLALLERAKNGERLPPQETVRLHRDGRLVEVSVSLSRLTNEHGALVGFAEVARPIAARRGASEEEYRLLFENNPHPMWVYETESLRFLAVNAAAVAHYGYSEEEFRSMTIRDIRPAEDYKKLEEILETIREGRKSVGQGRHCKKDGSIIHVEVSSDAIVFQGRPSRLVLADDITERKQAAEALKAREFFLSNAQRVARLGTWDIDLSRNHLTWSEETLRIFGVAPENFNHTLQDFLSRVHPEDIGWIEAKYLRPVEQGSVVEGEYRIVRPDGEERVVYERGEIVFDHLGKPIRQVGVVMDVTELKRTEKALQASEKEFRTLAEAMPQIVWISVPDKGNIYSNQRWMDYTGQAPEQSQGYGWSMAYHPDDRPRVIEAWKVAIESGETYFAECRLRRKDGAYRWWLSRAVPERDAAGKIVKWFGTSTDIDDLKQAENALKEKEALLRITGSTAKLGGWTLDIPSYDLIWSDEIYRIFEVPLGTPLNVEMAINFYAPEWEETIAKAVKDCSTLGTPYDLELEVITAKGGRRWVRSIGQPERDAEGKIWRIHGAFQDITDRKKAAEALRASAQRLEMAAKAGGMGVWELDLTTLEISCDEQMLVLYGMERTSGKDLNERWRKSVHPEDMLRTQLEFEEALREGGKPFDTEFRIIRCDDGCQNFLRGMATVIRDEVGKPVRMIGLNWDVTEQRAREEKLAEALAHERELVRQAQAGEQAKSEFLAVMSHEIRTPMNGILGFAEILSNELSLSPETKGYVQTIASSGEALLRILDDILDFSRIDAGRVVIEEKDFSPCSLIRDIEALFANQIREKGLAFHVSVGADLPEQLKGDAGRIRQILVNLTGNALKFTDHGSISLMMGVRGDLIEFIVRDTGAGIPSDKLASIFEPFTQADSANSRRKGGTGLGLTISRRLAELMGGRIEVTSEPGGGSTFLLFVPLEDADRPNLDPALELPTLMDSGFAHRHPLRILVVEDDKVNLKLILTMVCKLGYDPLMALNGLEAVEVFERERPDCILMDVQMPEMDGIEAARKIRELEESRALPAAYISALTANILPEDQRRCFDAGINFYLNKPVKSRAVADVLAEACTHRKKVAASAGNTEPI